MRHVRGTLMVVALAAAMLPGAASPETSPEASPAGTTASEPDLAGSPWFQVIPDRQGPRELYVGTLGGETHLALTTPGGVQVDGPLHGRLLAWWRDGDESVVTLVETSDGSSRELLRTTRYVPAAAFGADDDWYHARSVSADAGRTNGVFRGRLTGGPTQRIADGWAGSVSQMIRSVDGTRIALDTSLPDRWTHVYRVLDTTTQQVTRLPGPGYIDAVGFLGGELVVYEDARTDALALPLRAIAPDGSDRVVVDQDGWAAAIYPALDGSARLVYEGHDAEGHYTLSVIGPGEGPEDGLVIHTGGTGLIDPPIQMVWLRRFRGVEAPGYIPVMPHQDMCLAEDLIASFGLLPRLLVPLDGGSPVELGPEGAACAPPAGA